MKGFPQLQVPVRPFAMLTLLAVTLGLLGSPTPLRAGAPLQESDFVQQGVQGLDPNPDYNNNGRQNSWAWAMTWWKGHLYVGTNRAWGCATQASLNQVNPSMYPYPPTDPQVYCPGAPDPATLPLQAEIWRWTPPSTWDRVYQSPNSNPIPDGSGRFTSREIGFRGMLPYTEADGTEALYIGSCSPRFIWSALPPPTILRTTDGVNFTPLPQDPGTTLGTFPQACWRNPVVYNGHLFIQGGSVNGAGSVYEAADPAGGNNNFQQVSPTDMLVSALGTFNGHLYYGTRDLTNGYGVYRTDATGPTPYFTTPIVTNAGNMPQPLNIEVLSMKVFRGHLYVGMNGLQGANFGVRSATAELIRVNQDDSWDVVAGVPRVVNGAPKVPISGLPAGFGNKFNVHMWRMEVFDGNLYVGTFDSSDSLINSPHPPASISGFDLYTSRDGANFAPVTTTGFGDVFNFGARTLLATPYGLFVGSTNNAYGLKVYLGTPPGYQGFQVNVPLGYSTGAGSSQPTPPPLPTNTLTPRPTSPPSPTVPPTNTSGATNTPTQIVVPTNTATLAETNTARPTNEPTGTKTTVPTDTPTDIITKTPGSTNTATSGATKTPSPTNSPTSGATKTPSPTKTPTSAGPTNTPTGAATKTPGSTSTPTNTAAVP